MKYTVQIKRMPGFNHLPLPQKMSALASGFDLYAAIDEPITIHPGQRLLIPTGIAISMPPQLEAQIRPRSGLAYKYGITTLNAPGTIDADYRGEIKVLLINHGSEPFVIQQKDRIAQMVFQEVPEVKLMEVDILSETDRGKGGFGHTGI